MEEKTGQKTKATFGMMQDNYRSLFNYIMGFLQYFRHSQAILAKYSPHILDFESTCKVHKKLIGLGICLDGVKNYNKTPQEFIAFMKSNLPDIEKYEVEIAEQVQNLPAMDKEEARVLIWLHNILSMRSNQAISDYIFKEFENEIATKQASEGATTETKQPENNRLARELARIRDEKSRIMIFHNLQIISSMERKYLAEQLDLLKKASGAAKDPQQAKASFVDDLQHYIEHLAQDLQVKLRVSDVLLLNKLRSVAKLDLKMVEAEITALKKQKTDLQNFASMSVNKIVGLLEGQKNKMGDTAAPALHDPNLPLLVLRDYITFLKGMISDLISRYKDAEISKKLKKSEGYRQAIFYLDKYRFLSYGAYIDRNDGKVKMGMLAQIKKGFFQNDWKDFLGMIKEIKKVADYIKTQFADPDLAKEILDIYDKHTDDIKAWKQLIEEIVEKRLKNPESVKKTIELSLKDILGIADSRISELEKYEEHQRKKVIEIIAERIRQLDKQAGQTIISTKEIVEKQLNGSKDKAEMLIRKIRDRERFEKKEWEKVALPYQKKLDSLAEKMAVLDSKIASTFSENSYADILQGFEATIKDADELNNFLKSSSSGLNSNDESIQLAVANRLYIRGSVLYAKATEDAKKSWSGYTRVYIAYRDFVQNEIKPLLEKASEDAKELLKATNLILTENFVDEIRMEYSQFILSIKKEMSNNENKKNDENPAKLDMQDEKNKNGMVSSNENANAA